MNNFWYEIGVLKLEKAMRYESTSLMLRIMTYYNSIKIINFGFTFPMPKAKIYRILFSVKQ